MNALLESQMIALECRPIFATASFGFGMALSLYCRERGEGRGERVYTSLEIRYPYSCPRIHRPTPISQFL